MSKPVSRYSKRSRAGDDYHFDRSAPANTAAAILDEEVSTAHYLGAPAHLSCLSAICDTRPYTRVL